MATDDRLKHLQQGVGRAPANEDEEASSSIRGTHEDASRERATRLDGAGVIGAGRVDLEMGAGMDHSRVGDGGGQVVRAGELNQSCSICLFEYYLDEDVTLLPCGHLFHTEVRGRAGGPSWG